MNWKYIFAILFSILCIIFGFKWTFQLYSIALSCIGVAVLAVGFIGIMLMNELLKD